MSSFVMKALTERRDFLNQAIKEYRAELREIEGDIARYTSIKPQGQLGLREVARPLPAPQAAPPAQVEPEKRTRSTNSGVTRNYRAELGKPLLEVMLAVIEKYQPLKIDQINDGIQAEHGIKVNHSSISTYVSQLKREELIVINPGTGDITLAKKGGA